MYDNLKLEHGGFAPIGVSASRRSRSRPVRRTAGGLEQWNIGVMGEFLLY